MSLVYIMDCSQLVVEFRFHLLRVQPCAIQSQPNETKTILSAAILYHHPLWWNSEIVFRSYGHLIEVLNTWQYLLTHMLKIFYFLYCGYRFDKCYLLMPYANDMIVPIFPCSCFSVAIKVKSFDCWSALTALRYVSWGSTSVRFLSSPKKKNYIRINIHKQT